MMHHYPALSWDDIWEMTLVQIVDAINDVLSGEVNPMVQKPDSKPPPIAPPSDPAGRYGSIGQSLCPDEEPIIL